MKVREISVNVPSQQLNLIPVKLLAEAAAEKRKGIRAKKPGKINRRKKHK